MKTAIWTKIVFISIVLGFLGILLLSAAGMYLIEDRLASSIGEQYYEQIQRIASDYHAAEGSVEDFRDAFTHAAKYARDFQQCIIWFTDEQGCLIAPDSGSVPAFPSDNVLLLYETLEEDNEHYIEGDFFGFFQEKWLSMAVPVRFSEGSRGYIVLHLPMLRIYHYRDIFAGILIVLLIICYLLGMIPVYLYRNQVVWPIRIIIDSIKKYSSGDVNYRIPESIVQDKDFGYLASSLNYMAERINSNGEYQRRLLSDVSHDFRSPLTSIKGFASALQDGTIPPEMSEKYLKIIIHETERLEKLTQNLRALDSLDVEKRLLKPERFEISALFHDVRDSFDGICREKQIWMELTLPSEPLFVTADLGQIQQVMTNLVDNAIKFSPPGSVIHLEAYAQNEKVFITVKDHGAGIPASSISKIWDRFYKQDNSRGKDRMGSGLGLSIVKEIINAHGEHIDCISTVGVGTEFIFTLQKA